MPDSLAYLFRCWEIEAITTEQLIAKASEMVEDKEVREELVEHILLEDARIFI